MSRSTHLISSNISLRYSTRIFLPWCFKTRCFGQYQDSNKRYSTPDKTQSKTQQHINRLSKCQNTDQLFDVWREIQQVSDPPRFFEYVKILEKLYKWNRHQQYKTIYLQFLGHVVHYIQKNEKKHRKHPTLTDDYKVKSGDADYPVAKSSQNISDKTEKIPEISRFTEWDDINLMQPSFVSYIMRCAEMTHDWQTVDDWMMIYLLQEWPFNKLGVIIISSVKTKHVLYKKL